MGYIERNRTNIERNNNYLKNFNPFSVIKRNIDSFNPVILDVGSGSGGFLKDCCDTWDSFQAHCFEPQVFPFSKLREFVSGVLSESFEIKINSVAISNFFSESEPFYYHPDLDSGISGFLKMNPCSTDSINIKKNNENDTLEAYVSKLNKKTFVSVTTIDKYAEKEKIQTVDLLKIDVQGCEVEVLEGAKDVLSRTRSILVEINFYDLYERSSSFYHIESILMPYGFRLYDICHISKNSMNGRTDWVDAFYLASSL